MARIDGIGWSSRRTGKGVAGLLGALLLAACAAPPSREPAREAGIPAAAASQTSPPAVESRAEPSHAAGHHHHDQPATPARSDPDPPQPVTAPATDRPAPAAQPAAPDGATAARPEAMAPIGAAASAPPPRASAPPAPAPARAVTTTVTLEGRLGLRPGRGQPVGAEDYAEAVVWFVPEGTHVVRPGDFTMNTRQKGFEPPVLAVPVGSRVRFPNSDPVLHNVYSDTRGQSFDLGLYGAGESPVHQFKQPGVIDVHCNVHRRMQAKIVVVESHLIARIGADGRFGIGEVPTGPGRLIAWHPRGERVERRVTAGEAGMVEIDIPLTRPRAEAFAEGARR